MPAQGRIATALLSDVGRVRSNNEDVVEVDPELGLLILADGMGGHNAGEVASALAVATTLDVVREQWPNLQHGEIDPASGLSREVQLLQQALLAAHAKIYRMSQTQPQCAGMGTTAVVCLLHDDRMAIAHVGDSRLYRWRGGQLQQITRDHSLLEEMVARGHYSREAANQRVRKNVVTRALGVEASVDVDLLEETLQVGDIVLLCSDGLTDMLDDDAISATLAELAAALNQAAQALVDQANARGGRDNVSVVLARIDAPFPR
ncbi:MAG: Stp1/IreP family PP2C-type Ser/Thr phosphatase [Nevskia sp.]|nr:Stp1/IreP family PP2C-type Ser/Thr phosphatase [Nevskia sp.]